MAKVQFLAKCGVFFGSDLRESKGRPAARAKPEDSFGNNIMTREIEQTISETELMTPDQKMKDRADTVAHLNELFGDVEMVSSPNGTTYIEIKAAMPIHIEAEKRARGVKPKLNP